MEMYVAKGFEPVRAAFAGNTAELGDGGGAFCAYVDGEPVVDVWGGQSRPGRPWRAGDRAVLMSLTKGLATLCVQVLVDRGWVDVDAPVSRYWPAFAAAGKAEVLVWHVLTHTAGVLGFPGQRELLQLDGTGWDDYEAIADGLAAATPSWTPGTSHGYHALTYGWLLSELVYRVTGQRAGDFFHEEIAVPLGLDTRIGTPPAEQPLVAAVLPVSFAGLPPEFERLYEARQARTRDPGTLAGQAFAARDGATFLDRVDTFFADPGVLAAEIPSVNGTSTARGIARLFALLAMGGELDGVRLLSPETVAAFSTVRVKSPDAIGEDGPGALLVPRTLGYIGNFAAPGQSPRYGPTPEAYGAEGGGGEIGICDPVNRVSIGFVRSHLAMSGAFSARLIDTLYRCLAERG
ncbi:serine hydrolase domain-containing protein [Nonomuraea sp. NPDC049141]|uniref:serine hydrolase domain-containing protein n=1 Tax=Nonomuraea sp. NPDC049141 TaxID=3155500 RepID=UPI0033FD887F